MNRCENCGTEFEGKFCPECGARWGSASCPSCGAEVIAGTKFCPECGAPLIPNAAPRTRQTRPVCVATAPLQIVYRAMGWAPAVLFALFSVLLFAFFAAPVVVANGMLISGTENLYGAIGSADFKDLHVTLYALIAFASLGALLGLIGLAAKFQKVKDSAFQVCAYILYLLVALLGGILIGKVNQLDEQFSGGLGMFSAGSCQTLLIVFAVLFAVCSIGATVGRRFLLKQNPWITDAEALAAEQRETVRATGRTGWFRKHIKVIVPIMLVTAVAVVLLSLIPTFKLMTVNGTYYASYGGELNKEKYVTLKTGKWDDSDGASGRYEVSGKSVRLFAKDPVTGLEMQLNAAVENGVLVVGDTSNYKRYVKESHKHKYGEWETVTEPTCVKEGAHTHNCLCVFVETQPIAAMGHNYGNWKVTTEPTCVDEGVRSTICSVCGDKKTQSIAATDIHKFSKGKCYVCGLLNLNFQLNADKNSYTLKGFELSVDYAGKLNIPIVYQNLPVTSIGEHAFSGCSGLTSVEIPDSVVSIGGYAFYGCSKLTSVEIPDSVTSIEMETFSGCSGLRSVIIPDSVTSIGAGAFRGCSGLTSVTIPDSVTSIGTSALRSCSRLTRIEFQGTKAQWRAIEKESYWDEDTGDYTVYCTDGEIKKGE